MLRGAATGEAAPSPAKGKKTGLPGGFQELDIVVPYQRVTKVSITELSICMEENHADPCKQKAKGVAAKQAGDIFEDIFAFTDSN